MTKPINFGLLLTTLSTLLASCFKDVECITEPFGLQKELANRIRANVLERTNFYRDKHGIDELTLSEGITEESQKHANYLAMKNELEHNMVGHTVYGENIAETRILPNIGETVVNLWYSVIVLVDVGGDESTLYNNTNIGTMTQLLWRASTAMGVGVSRNQSGTYWVVANYDPRGNAEPNSYLANLPQFTRDVVNEDVEEGNAGLAFDDLIKIKSISLSNLRTGPVEFPEIGADRRPLRRSSKPVATEKVSISKSSVPAKGFGEREAIMIRERISKRINYYRKKHKIDSLVLDAKLNDYAQDWANYMASMGTTANSPLKGLLFGENVNTSDVIVWGDFGEIAVDRWYNEISDAREHMTESNFQDEYHHMENATQLLWKSTTMMGVGVAVDGIEQYHVVVDFRPGGNLRRRFVVNLPNFELEDISAALQARVEFDKITAATQSDVYPLSREIVYRKNH